MKKQIIALALASLMAAPVAFASGESFVVGGVQAGALVSYGTAGFQAGYSGYSGTSSWTGMTQVQVAGRTQGIVEGRAGSVEGVAQSSGQAYQSGNYTVSQTGSKTGNAVFVVNGFGQAASQAGAGAGAQSSNWRW